MIFGWIRLWAMALIGLTVIYFLVGIYWRSLHREELEKRFDAGGIEGERSAYIENGMVKYEKGLKKRLLWLIYIIPTIAFFALVYILNFQ
ncbi:hypothetical protein ACSBLW_11780 [Thioclava sp. FR2]|uniref:hypothetical protein n=1 Tax=Thioclava sp. FR2 TaxID=3445780 RepID=UPI003EBB8BE5